MSLNVLAIIPARGGSKGIPMKNILPLVGKPLLAYNLQAIRDLVSQPERYYALCQSTRRRYERELNSDVAGKRLSQILKDVVLEK